MAESSEDFSVHRFVQELFEDLSLTLPSLGCRFEGVVTPSALTVHGRTLFLKNKLFLLFADLSSQSATLHVKFRLALHSTDLVLGFGCQPFFSDRVVGLPTWDKDLFSLFSSEEDQGFQLVLPAGKPLEVGPPVHWRELAQLYGGQGNGRKVLDHFLIRCHSLLPDLDAAIRASDAPAVLRVAHTLKGSARGVTAQALAEAALQLEMLGRSGNLASADELYRNLVVTYDQFIQWVREGQQ
jgi:HPt (histidine-containing phosphotransfer) domain-containing protein